MRRNPRMTAPLQPSIADSPLETLVVFDFRVPGTGRRMRREAYSWKSCASIERLDQYHAVMTIRPGGARELIR